MADIEKVIKGLERCLKHTCPAIYSKEYKECEYTVGLYCGKDKLLNEALDLLKEQKAEIDRLKQGNLVDVDKLREKLGFSESCDKCKKDSWQCQRDMYFSEMDFCDRLDIAIEELIQEGR